MELRRWAIVWLWLNYDYALLSYGFRVCLSPVIHFICHWWRLGRCDSSTRLYCIVLGVFVASLDIITMKLSKYGYVENAYHRPVRGLWQKQGIPCFCKIPTVQQSPEKEMPYVYVTLATDVTLATAWYFPCLFGYVTIGLARHNRTHVSQSELLLVKPQRPCTDLCAEPAGVWNRLRLTRYAILRVAHAPGMPGTFSPPPG